MTDLLRIEARLPLAAGLELRARLLALRPLWDAEVTEGGFIVDRPLTEEVWEEDWAVLEEAVTALERNRSEMAVELAVSRLAAAPPPPPPPRVGPWRLKALTPGQSWPRPEPETVLWPPFLRAGRLFWAGTELLTALTLDHFSPPPGAPETLGQPALVLEAGPPAAALAARRAGAGEVTLAAEETVRASAQALFTVNGFPGEPRTPDQPFKTLARKRDDWAGRFGFIAVHLSPYLAARRLKTLANWLAPEGALVLAGFAPGPQTAHLLRASARAGLSLAGSIVENGWAALKLTPAPRREALPPLTGSLVPELMELPEAPFSLEAEEGPEWDLDQPSLMLADDPEESEEE